MWEYTKDLGERVAWTYAQGLVGLVTADQFNLIDLTSWRAAAIASLPAAVALLKGGVARYVGDRSTAATLPKKRVA